MLAELRAERPAVLKVIEGYVHKLEQADLDVITRQEVEALKATTEMMDRTIVNLDAQISQAKVVTLDLMAQGFPELPSRETDERVTADLDQNIECIVAARAQFKQRAVTTVGTSTVGPEEPVP